MRALRSFVAGFWRTEKGAAAVEYVLILAIVCCGLAVGASVLAGSINEALAQLKACVEHPINCFAPG